MKMKIPKKVIAAIIFLSLIFIYLILSVVISGAIFTTKGIVYLILNIAAIAGLIFCGRKFYLMKKEEDDIKEIINDPEKLYKKLTEHGNTLIDDGKLITIGLKEDKKTKKKVLDISVGKQVRQEWRKKYETTPIEQESKNRKDKEAPKKDKKGQAQAKKGK